jgi:hypothetical protein
MAARLLLNNQQKSLAILDPRVILGVFPHLQGTSMTAKRIPLSQVINAERWLSTELKRLEDEGHKIVGDSVLLNVKAQANETVSRPA